MAIFSSLTLRIGSSMPSFTLPSVLNGAGLPSDEIRGVLGILVFFLCRHCPYVMHVRDEVSRIATEARSRGIFCVGISSNDVSHYPDDSPSKLAEMVREYQIPYPILYDETQDIARAFEATCTPDFFLFDGGKRLFYRGRLDDSTPKNGKPITGADLRGAIDLMIAGKMSPPDQHPSMGCSIKWK